MSNTSIYVSNMGILLLFSNGVLESPTLSSLLRSLCLVEYCYIIYHNAIDIDHHYYCAQRYYVNRRLLYVFAQSIFAILGYPSIESQLKNRIYNGT